MPLRERAVWGAVAVVVPVGVLFALHFAYEQLRTPRFHYQYLGEAASPAPSAAPTRLCPARSPQPQPTSKEQALEWAATARPASLPPPIPASDAQARAALDIAGTDPTVRSLTRNSVQLYAATLRHELSDVVLLDLAVPDDLAGDFPLPWLDTEACRVRVQIMRIAHAQGAQVEVDLPSRQVLGIDLYNHVAARDRTDRE